MKPQVHAASAVGYWTAGRLDRRHSSMAGVIHQSWGRCMPARLPAVHHARTLIATSSVRLGAQILCAQLRLIRLGACATE